MEGEICFLANREFGLDKYTKTEICGLPTVEELRASLLSGENSDARTQLAMLFDEATFVETNAYAKRAFSLRSLDSRRFSALYTNYVSLHYLKLIMEVNGYSNTDQLGPHIDLKDTSLKILEKIDSLGYSMYQRHKNESHIK